MVEDADGHIQGIISIISIPRVLSWCNYSKQWGNDYRAVRSIGEFHGEYIELTTTTTAIVATSHMTTTYHN